ncbi:hypothetical protein K432DRAFT_39736 [Lepidopterella palustris CBS 459.81]|uniref:Uncharacterized protein n=1 Tax=Lepidopterella palustris CBS 459.81 TaxID=1314670 RepID=A0A8E2EAU4_9PEZI|nr:hypothetical protein K432DRAFT_39736 [Lepidopterella palustris CBS 459.81]
MGGRADLLRDSLQLALTCPFDAFPRKQPLPLHKSECIRTTHPTFQHTINTRRFNVHVGHQCTLSYVMLQTFPASLPMTLEAHYPPPRRQAQSLDSPGERGHDPHPSAFSGASLAQAYLLRICARSSTRRERGGHAAGLRTEITSLSANWFVDEALVPLTTQFRSVNLTDDGYYSDRGGEGGLLHLLQPGTLLPRVKTVVSGS